MKMKELAPTKQIAIKTLNSAFKALKNAGGELPYPDIIKYIENEIEFNEYELEEYKSNGQKRWITVFYFYTIDCVKAGFLTKNKGVWYLTKEGEKAYKLGAMKLFELANEGYKKWEKKRKKNAELSEDSSESEKDFNKMQAVNIAELESKAIIGIQEYIKSLNPYEFQKIVATLLDSMGYHIAFNAPRGPDGGIDIIAYNDPLGTKQPRIIVQVKHQPDSSVSPDLIQKLSGAMKRQSDVGIFVTSGKFSKNAIIEARNSQKHIELINIIDFVDLWQEFYEKMNDEQKNQMTLHRIYFYGGSE